MPQCLQVVSAAQPAVGHDGRAGKYVETRKLLLLR
jgi:hypothetical protein